MAVIRLDEIRNERIKTIDIYDKDELVRKIEFNPYDTNNLEKFFSIIDKSNEGSQKIKELKLEIDGMDGIDGINGGFLDIEADSAEEFQLAKKTVDIVSKGLKISVDTFNEMTKVLDEIFGEGTCQLFLRGYNDSELLTPLLDTAMPFFEQAYSDMRKKVERAKLNREERRASAKARKLQ